MREIRDLIGERFGMLTAVEMSPERGCRNKIQWICKCDCGNVKQVTTNDLMFGRVKSCGCYMRKWIGEMGSRNKFVFQDDYVDIFGKGGKFICRCDASDYELISKYTWCLSKGYAHTNLKNGSRVNMARMMLNPLDSECVDHINGDTKDNRRKNLRVCTQNQNAQNTKISLANKSGVKGVFWHKGRSGWVATITANGKTKYIGLFKSFDSACSARKKAEEELHGEFARQAEK